MVEDLVTDRAWIEIDLDNLEHNIREIQRIIPSNTKIMAVVKANAYGHGMVSIARKLNEIGIFDFAVATLEEGITLRKNQIQGNILILGYTSIENIKYVVSYDLIQTIVDMEYASRLSSLGMKIKTQIKVNTGMNRIGIPYKEIESIKKIYQNPLLEVSGIFSHFCVADSGEEEDIAFTHMQIDRFNTVIEELKIANIMVGKTHLQSSYGILNYPECKYDYVRPGIIMYGVDSEKNVYKKQKLDMKPVLSLKARVTSVKEIEEGTCIGYGRKYKANQKEKIVSVSIGYADGYPRNLSCKGAKVLINGEYADVVGRICMDQLMVRTSLIDVKEGDVVTLLGGEDLLSATEIASLGDTITNELFSRLGERLGKDTRKVCK